RNKTVTVTINGTDLQAATGVTVSGSGVTVTGFTVLSDTQVQASFVISGTAAIGTRTVTVQTPSGNPTTQFSVLGPVLNTISPTSGTHGTTVPVSLAGTNLTGTTSINVAGLGITVTSLNVVSDTQVTANFVIASSASLTTRNVSVTTAAGTSNNVPGGFTVH
ncbi:MAG TPA: hypothetical protein VJQ54_03630, partial [Candidatus Sulfotelmatobacter sp.]|nr:hypothetical protein [Candidatus Sulfotelmatobacter sp.]